ncbi:MAG: DNA-directed RNA polymerase subunit alpha [Bacteroidetes bacterium RIFCSPLOWO2_02_FULL_36_8]|nr:MAG: DNA-directed RNA polymerase subunit alpha [Bacteroidetes bacterium RIFCSPLOWO2_02_FULL_36_8]OFY68822.1 MAG: DNA-directed RNA polymerase subunit alpha [Bacteroidetes bacterium RIFCSPLOWO2_12_FULL_37_12]
MALFTFQMPEKVVMEKADDFHGIFEFKPLEKGYGITVGNALRRILLSSLEGYAITSIKVNNILHEFTTIEGVVEDLTEIILNLKQVRFKKILDSNDKIYVSIKNMTAFTAGDIAKHTNAYQILNPDMVICHMEPFVNFELELTIEKGRGYVPAEENKKPDQSLGTIAIDSVFTPIKNVKYKVENFRVEQKTDYEKLIIEILTDGSIHPEEALKGAASILIKHFLLISDKNITMEFEKDEILAPVDENFLHMRKVLKTPLSDLDLSVRAYNCLKAADIKTLAELVTFDIGDMLKFRNFGKKSLSELEELVKTKGLSFGMDITKYKLDEE